MATSIQYDMVAAVEHEISCPVCLEEFEEPKCLPSCAHNVCRHCLHGMVKKRSNAIECPVCRVKSIIPQGGVAAFPKNHLLVRLIERTPGRKEKKVIKEAVNNFNEKLKGAKAAMKEMEDHFASAKIQDEETIQKIESLAENVVAKVREQERKMVEQITMSHKLTERKIEICKSKFMLVCENASGCIQTIEDILQNGELRDLINLKEALIGELNDFSKSLEIHKRVANSDFLQLPSVSLLDTDSAKKFIEDECCLLGRLAINTGTASYLQDISSASAMSVVEATPVTSKGIDYSRCGSLIQIINSSSCKIAKFNPFAVAASSSSDHFVVLDEETKWVHIFNEEGVHLNKFHIKYGDLWDVAVSNENEIVVVNRKTNCLLHYDMNGNFQKKSVTAPKENVKFTSLSVDVHGHFIISSYPFYDNETQDDVKSCILVYRPSGELTLSFGEGRLLSPEKAVFLNGKFFVGDSGHNSVMVFNKSGTFLEKFGSNQLKSPSFIAADCNGNLVACSTENCTIYIYSQVGQLLHHFQTEHKPGEVAFTKNHKILLICCDIDDDNAYIQMVAYS